MAIVNLVRFYRIKGIQFVRVQALARSGATGYRSDESWLVASGKFNDSDDAPGPDVTAMYHAAPVWQTWKSVPIEFDRSFSTDFATARVLYDKVNADLTSNGYTRPDGSSIG